MPVESLNIYLKDYCLDLRDHVGYAGFYGVDVIGVFAWMLNNGVKEVLVTPEEMETIVMRMCPDVHWDGKTMWGIKLILYKNEK